MEKEQKLYLLLGFYVLGLVASNLLGGKLMPIGFGDRGLTVSIILFPFLFLVTDIVGEVCGKKKAQQFIKVGLITLLVLILFQLFALNVPAAAPGGEEGWYATAFNPAYGTIFGFSLTFTIASICAFFFGQYVDVGIYHLMKKVEGKKLLWLRNNVSTMVGQFVDSSLWVLIAFSPKLLDGSFTILSIYSIIIIPYWLAKVVFAIVDTPLVYLGVWWLKKEDK